VRTPVLDLFRPAVRACCRLYFGLELRGAEHVPLTGPAIIVPNHQTYADPPLVTIPVRRPVYYMAWDRLFGIPGFGLLIRRLRAFPVDIEARDSAALRHVLRILKAGEAVMIFPEGERTRDGRLAPFKLGAFRLAVSTGAPVVPVTIAGGHECWPPGQWLPRPGRIRITYHPPLGADPRLDQRAAARALADATRAAIVSALSLQPDGRSTR
jgi:1-acyl-sn-glycerol-3-phosphate acyltransferase